MRDVSESLAAHLASGATTMCRCWKIQRTDGIVFGFTDHDEPLEFDDVQFDAASGLTASAIQAESGLSVDNSQLSGALTSAAITESDIQAGRFDNADVWHWHVNWQDVQDRVLIFRGSLGDITRGEKAFEAELRGLSHKLNLPVGRRYLRQCNCQFGDEKCGIDTTSSQYTLSGEVIVSADRKVFKFADDGKPDDWYQHGVIIWTSGDLDGLQSRVASDKIDQDKRLITLDVEAPFDLSEGTTFDLVVGCDKQANTCQEKFGNFLNFQGFPYIPGEDWALTYPVQGEGADGGSLAREVIL